MLRRLTSSGEVDLLVHEVVAREFKSQRMLQVQAQAEKIIEALSEMSRQVDAKGTSHRDLTEMRSKVIQISEGAQREVERDFTVWLTGTGAHWIAFDPEVMRQVLDDYFEGAGAFRKPKHRDDIPDAIFASAFKPVLSKYQNLHIAVKDAAFRKYLQAEPKFTIIEGLSEFFALDVVKTVTEDLDKKEKNLNEQIKLFSSNCVRARIVDYLKGAKELLEDVYLQEERIDGLDALEMHIIGASLNYPQADAISNVSFGEPNLIDRGHLSIPVVIRTLARIDYGADFVEVQKFEESRDIDNWSMDGEGVCDLREVREVDLIGFLDLHFDPELSPVVLQTHTEYFQANKPNIEISLEIEKARIF
jgi:hypothetical protein